MLRIINLEEIQGFLLSVPALVDLHDQGNGDFVLSLKQWLIKLEKVLEANRMAVAGNVASLRATLISAERGTIPNGIEFQSRVTGRRIREAAAALVLQQASDLISNTINKDSERVAEAERMVRQLVILAKSKGLIQKLPGEEISTNKLKIIWSNMSTDPALSSGTLNVESLVGPNDAMVIFDRVVSRDTP